MRPIVTLAALVGLALPGLALATDAPAPGVLEDVDLLEKVDTEDTDGDTAQNRNRRRTSATRRTTRSRTRAHRRSSRRASTRTDTHTRQRCDTPCRQAPRVRTAPPARRTVEARRSARPPAARPARPARPAARPAARTRPAPARTVVRHRSRMEIVHTRPWHGVFVYGPRPTHHVHYVNNHDPVLVEAEHLPERKVDREGSFALGLRSGSYLTAYNGGGGYGDLGLGLVGRYRPEEAFGLELAVQHHNETFDLNTERSQTLMQGSAMLFANPWGRVQPYVLGGLSANARGLDDAIQTDTGPQVVRAGNTLWGPHAGAGIEFAFGKRAALDLEVRYVGWMNVGGDDPTAPGAFQTNAGFLVHF